MFQERERNRENERERRKEERKIQIIERYFSFHHFKRVALII